MTDADLLGKKLAQVQTYLAELRRLAKPERLDVDLRERRFVEHTLQMAIQAALDAASHVVSDQRLGEPKTNAELFTLLASAGWVTEDLAEPLRRMAGFRNVLVHGYADVDLDLMRDVLAHHLGDLDRFVVCVESRLTADRAKPRDSDQD